MGGKEPGPYGWKDLEQQSCGPEQRKIWGYLNLRTMQLGVICKPGLAPPSRMGILLAAVQCLSFFPLLLLLPLSSTHTHTHTHINYALLVSRFPGETNHRWSLANGLPLYLPSGDLCFQQQPSRDNEKRIRFDLPTSHVCADRPERSKGALASLCQAGMGSGFGSREGGSWTQPPLPPTRRAGDPNQPTKPFGKSLTSAACSWQGRFLSGVSNSLFWSSPILSIT